MEIKNADDLIKQVELQVKGITDAQAQEVNNTLKKYHAELAENGKASKETKEQLVKHTEDLESLKSNSEEVKQQLVDINQKLSEGYNARGQRKSIGQTVVDSNEFASYKSGEVGKMTIAVKNTIITESGSPLEPSGDLVAPQYAPFVALPYRAMNVLDVINWGRTTSNIVHIPKEATRTNSAAETAQAASKPESAITYSSQELPVRTIAHWLKVSTQALDDAPLLAGHINTTLFHGVRHRLQTQVITGNGTSPNLSGLTDSGNFTAFTPTTGDTATDSINRAKYEIVGDDLMATHILMNPATFGAIERVKVATSGRNDYASSDGVALAYINGLAYLWGLPVVLSNDVTADKLLMIDNNKIGGWVRDDVSVQMFEQDDTNVQENLVTVRAEMRAAFGVFNANAVQYGDLTV
ncbi:MAG: phage major capsid protein [Ignavibacteriaceae bacterium]|nr:phage major capsid protein [Ignavibacteriaceae bacterium]